MRSAKRVGRKGSAAMSEENKATSRRFYEELFNQGNLEAAEEIVTPTSLSTIPTFLKSREALRA